MRMIRALAGSMLRKSLANAFFASSAIAPAISTPVGPAPTTMKLSRPRRSSSSVSVSAFSKARRICRLT